MSFIATLSTSNFDSQYVQAVRELDSWSGNIEAISPPAEGGQYPKNGNAEDVLNQVKTVVAAWPNTISPLCHAVPGDIVQWNPQLQSDLSQLQAYSEQPEPYSDSVKQGISHSAEAILNILTQTSSQILSLATGLEQFASQMDASCQQLMGLSNTINCDMASYQSSLAALYGELRHLESASKPDKGKIREVEQEIVSVREQLEGAQAWSALLNQILPGAQESVHETIFLSSYWRQFASDLDHVIGMLRLVRQNPSRVTIIELTAAEASWERIYQNMLQIEQQLS